MDYESSDDSVVSDSSCSPLPYSSSVLSYLPRRYDRSLIIPSKLSERKYDPHANAIQLPPLKLSSGVTQSEEENFLALRTPTTEGELILFKQKYNRLRVTLSVRVLFILNQSFSFFQKIGKLIRGMCNLNCMPASLFFFLR